MTTRFLKTSVLVLIAVHLAASGSEISGQETKQEQIYLDELGTEPPPKVVRQDTVQDKYEDGALRIERGVARLSDDQLVNHGKYVEYYRDGQKYAEGRLDMGLHTGQWQYWHPNGQLCKSPKFVAGKPHGKWEVFRADGTRESSKNYENGFRHGKWISYFEGGEQAKVELSYEMGRIEGDRLTYYKNGQLRQQIPFKKNQMHGKVISWDESGNKVSEMQFEEGKLSEKPQYFQNESPSSE